MTLRTGLLITGDTAGAQKALSDLERNMERTGAAAEGLAASERAAEAAGEGLEQQLRQALTTIGALENDVAGARAALAGLGGAAETAQAGIGRAAGAGRLNTKSLAEQQLGARMLGQQFQDMAVMGSMAGTSLNNWLRVFTSQIGQTAYAVEQMGAQGALGRAAAFMNTPWGAAVTGAAIVLAPFIGKLFEASQAAEFTADYLDKAATSADSFGAAETMLGKIIDLTTGKLKTHNSVLIETIKLQAQLNLAEAQKKINEATGYSGGYERKMGSYVAADGMMGGYVGDIGEQQARFEGNARLKAVTEQLYGALGRVVANGEMATRDPSGYADLVNGQLERSIAVLDGMADSARFTGKALGDAKAKLLELANAGTDKAAALMSISVANGGAIPDDLTPYAKAKKPRTKKPKSTEARDEFGRDAADRIAAITAAFDETPSAVQQADKAIRQIDDLIDDLGRKKPPNFEALISSAEQAKIKIEDGLIRSVGEAFDKPKTLADKATEALATLDGALGKEGAKLKAGLIDKATFDDFEKRVADSKRKIDEGLNRPYEQFVEQQQDALAIQGLMSQGRDAEAEALRTIIQLEKNRTPLTEAQKTAILDSVKALDAEVRATQTLHEKQQAYLSEIADTRSLISATIEEGTKGIEQLPDRLLGSFKHFFAEWFTERYFGSALRQLQALVEGRPEDPVKEASVRLADAVDGVSGPLRRLGALINGVTGSAGSAGLASMGGAIGSQIAAQLNGEANILVEARKRSALSDPRTFMAEAVGKLTKAVGINDEAARKIGKGIASGLEGAFFGQLASSVASIAGIKQSGTGASIGGALGGAAATEWLKGALGSFAGPLGGIVGGLLGGTIGALFGGSKPYGTALLGSATDAARLGGSSADMRGGAGSLAGEVQSGVKQIADQLGGVLGNFDLAIGEFNGRYRVRTTTSGWDGKGPLDYKGNSGNNLYDFADEQSAVAFAIMDAIKDGAVGGLSAAVQKALGKSSDINEALTEALKVADVEKLLGGLPAELTDAFGDFEKQAADRLRIAREYGLDVVKIEEINAKQRLALQQQLLDQQVGSLQRLVDEMTSGSLFEGSLVDQRTALLGEIEKAKADLDSGVEGAADKLAGLLEQLNAVSKDVYGTTGGFASDRSAILDQARAAIAQANAQIAAAQAQATGTDPALATTNAALDENNDQNARMLSLLDEIRGLLKSSGATGTDLSSLIAMARTS